MTRRSRLLARLAAVVLLLAAAFGATAQTARWNAGQPGEQLSISLVTFGPGKIYWERFGHNAIVVRDAASGEAVSYNYGIFDFEEDDFFWNFLRGYMMYSMAANRYEDDVAMYAHEGRWVVEQELNFSPAQRLALAAHLAWNLKPENARYRYEYFTSNCSTRVRDAFDRVLGGAIHKALVGSSRGYTYRLYADRLISPDPELMLPMDLGLGPFADKRLSFWDESFIPMSLMEHLKLVSVVDDTGASVPLIGATRRLHEADAELAADARGLFARGPYPFGFAWPAGILGAAIGLALIALAARRTNKTARYAFAILASWTAIKLSLAGLVLVGLWLGTEHISAWHNENILLLDPLLLLLVPTFWRARKADWTITPFARAVAALVVALAVFAAFAKVLPWFKQDNTVWLALLVPLHLGLAVAMRYARRG
ncbi:DUF4105 domain-containing protein [Tahibacter soli]|uniref:DUF4105 domain-containing protein n=1 Tax=Tahibacter soli TaxID=2983605 RepID=A0A9X4BJV6_9GAMM|nr:DUF4105 domain-containing protein [Tahibacter soli]MDC8015491.1 DUF4105 domain-containing protein [Tahibacter soli]